jgi:hypothetical protein
MNRPCNVFHSSTTMIHMYVCLESLYPETTADKARATNAKKAMLMAAAVASVKLLTTADLMRFVMGTAAESADISKYATACECIHRSLLDKTIMKHCNQLLLKKIMVTNSSREEKHFEKTTLEPTKEKKRKEKVNVIFLLSCHTRNGIMT